MISKSDAVPHVLTVGELNRLARMALEKGLPSCRVRGEISNFSSATSRHWYFTLKDDQAGVRCVMFRTRNQFVDWTPRDGDQVELRVQPTLYEQRGDYQLLVDAMRKAGQGSLFEAYLRLKNKLETEGLLSLARKRTIPQFPRSIGIITSPQAAALRDVLSTITARWPGCGVILYPTPVQGDSAARGLIEAISTAGLRRECDVLLLVRGGGSLEDLLGFNDESVARAIVACPIPIVSGVGHETDFTIADFVADLRAPTPTGAAQLATPSRIDIRLHIQHLNTRLYQIQQSKFHALSQQLDGLRRRVTHPRDRIAFRRQQIRHLTWRLNIAMKAGVDSGASPHERRLHAAMHKLIEDRGQSVRVFLSHLELLSPSSVLRRGYSIVLNERREVLRDAAEVVIGQHLEIRLAQGALGAEVVRIEDSNN
jgi:exodeoxyribonuclease VII large subunit